MSSPSEIERRKAYYQQNREKLLDSANKRYRRINAGATPRAKPNVPIKEFTVSIWTPPNKKTCCICRRTKDKSDFITSSAAIDGKGSRCKPCDSARRRQRRQHETAEYFELRRLNSKQNDIHCPGCKTNLPHSSFFKNKMRATGVSSYCRVCERRRMKAWACAHKEQYSATKRRNKKTSIMLLSEAYLRDVISRNSPIDYKDVPLSLIDVKRVHIQIKRLIKDITDEEC